MTPADIALARRAVACKGWRWMPGMRAVECATPGMALWRDGFDRITEHTLAVDHNMLPDLTDPATVGCLLALVREAWDCDEWRRLTIEPAGAGWCVVLRNARHQPPSRAAPGWALDGLMHPRYLNMDGPLGKNEFPTEVDALIAALESVP